MGVQLDPDSLPANMVLSTPMTRMVSRFYRAPMEFGLVPCTTISGKVWTDRDGDGTPDTPTGGVAGAEVRAGDRRVPAHVERQLFFLLSRNRGSGRDMKPCWVIKKCPKERKERCPAWEFQAGKLCWFINGTLCECKAQKNWKEKMNICRSCEVLRPLLEP